MYGFIHIKIEAEKYFCEILYNLQKNSNLMNKKRKSFEISFSKCNYITILYL